MKALKGIVLAVVAIGIVVSGVALWRLKNAGAPITVNRILVDVDASAVAGGVDREDVRRVVNDVVREVRGVTFDEAGRGGGVLRVRVDGFNAVRPPAVEGHPPVESSSSLTLSAELFVDGRPAGRGLAVANAQGVMGTDALVSQSLRDALNQLMQIRAADDLDSDTLLTWVTDPTVGAAKQRRAMQALASRQERRATPALVAMLSSTDEGNAAAALQALTVMRDPAATTAIIDYSARQPPIVRKLCIDAVRAAGAKEAVPWLFTLTTGHPDGDVQAYASAALAQLQATSLSTGPTVATQAGG